MKLSTLACLVTLILAHCSDAEATSSEEKAAFNERIKQFSEETVKHLIQANPNGEEHQPLAPGHQVPWYIIKMLEMRAEKSKEIAEHLSRGKREALDGGIFVVHADTEEFETTTKRPRGKLSVSASNPGKHRAEFRELMRQNRVDIIKEIMDANVRMGSDQPGHATPWYITRMLQRDQ